MGKKAAKATRKFAASGQLKKVIQDRRKHQQIKRKIQGKRKPRVEKRDEAGDETEEDQDLEEPLPKATKPAKGKTTLDNLLDGNFMDDTDENEDEDEGFDEDLEDAGFENDEDAEDIDDNASFASVDDLDDGEAHLEELSKLAEKDPEFYKYLQENDRELLDFDLGHLQDNDEDEDEDEDVEMGEDETPILTAGTIQKWQKALLESRSLRALRKLLIAFRSAAHMNEDDVTVAWRITSSNVYHKLVSTAFKYTPMVLEHHVPYKTLSNGKIKPPTQTPKFKTLQKLILSHFNNAVHILSQLTDQDMLHMAVTESAKLIPYIASSRHAVRLYLKASVFKTCLGLWSSAQDNIRIAAFLAIRNLASMNDESILDNVLKGTYLTLIRSSRSTSVHTLPSINLMKNSASEVFCIDHSTAYQHSFGYIRQLAIHLRNSMKMKTKEAYKQVYNWQFVHCIDFWTIVLARACDVRSKDGGQDSDLKPLIYPLVQVCLGAIRLIPTSRSYPFHLHIARSLLHLTKHTETFVSLSPYLVPIISTTLAPSSRPKPSTLRPLDLEVTIRVPQQYLKTRVYSEGILEEATYLLTEWLASPAVQASIAFPEIIVPIIALLRKSLKNGRNSGGSGSGKDQALVKTFLERLEESGRWVETRRKDVTFSPGHPHEVEIWEQKLRSSVGESPLGKYLKVQKKTREKRRKLMEKAREGEDEILESE